MDRANTLQNLLIVPLKAVTPLVHEKIRKKGFYSCPLADLTYSMVGAVYKMWRTRYNIIHSVTVP
jgi:hypothetical protein